VGLSCYRTHFTQPRSKDKSATIAQALCLDLIGQSNMALKQTVLGGVSTYRPTLFDQQQAAKGELLENHEYTV
jgi:hypothetical protein